MYDTVNLWIDRGDVSGGNTFEALPYLSNVTERQNEQGYSCCGNVTGYNVYICSSGISLKGSLSKSYFDGDNVATLTRRATQEAIEKLSDILHTDVGQAKVTRVDVATVIPTKRPPPDYYAYMGLKTHFKRLQAAPETLYYNNHQKQLVLYDKAEETKDIPELMQKCNMLRYEFRLTKRVSAQLKTKVTAQTLHDEIFYQNLIMRWFKEFQSIQKIQKQSFMTDKITTVKEAENALFAHLLQQSGQGIIDEFLNELKANSTFKERPRYSELKKRLHTILEAPRGEKSDLVQELETAIYNVAKYAR